jgi:neopullulanase
MRKVLAAISALVLIFMVPALGCGSRWAHLNDGPDSRGQEPGPGALDDGGAQSADGGDVAVDAGPTVLCPVTLRVAMPVDFKYASVAVTGEFNAFAKPGIAMTGPDASGAYVVDLKLFPGVVGYRLFLDGALVLDPSASMRKYVGGVENSAIRVADCRFPSLAVTSKNIARAAEGKGRFTAKIAFGKSIDGAPIDSAKTSIMLRKEGAFAPVEVTASSADGIDLDLNGLADGKYTAQVRATDVQGRPTKPLRLVFWIEAEAFDWRDAVIYMAMTDRFKDGDPSNNAQKTDGVEPRADFHGGDLQGVRDAIKSGALDRLGIRAIWLTPFNTNPTGSFLADDGVHQVTGYHGYWPIKPREVDPRIGGEAGLRALVAEAHAHGIRVVQDFVVNHVHEQHEYFKSHPDWFRTGCVCGTASCDWTEKRLDCLFTKYLPDVNWANNDVSEQFSDDAVFWLNEFDIDGLRIDAVKHVEDAAVINMTSRIREELEAGGTRVFLTGETAMGWSDCGIDCNKDQYGTINRYMGSRGLDGQFDFVLYHAVAYRTFFYGDRGMIHADYWTKASISQFVPGSIMTPYIGSHDTPRSVTLSTYRGQSGFPRNVPDRKWANVAEAPTLAESPEAYGRQRTAMAWLLGLPGAPLIYYGDEYGQWGGSDPNNREGWRGDAALSAEEQTSQILTEKLGSARRELVALRRGDYVSVYNTDENVLVYARKAGANVALVAVSRLGSPATVTIVLPASLGIATGTVLRDRITGATFEIAQGSLQLVVPARGSLVLAP